MTSAKAERFTFLINGTERTLEADGKTPLLDVLRNTLGLTGTRFGCGNEECGACFVLVDGHAVASCNTLGAPIETLSVDNGRIVSTIGAQTSYWADQRPKGGAGNHQAHRASDNDMGGLRGRSAQTGR